MIKNREQILYDKWADQDGQCVVCGQFLSTAHFQLAHVVPKTKPNIKKYGLDIIDHPDNLRLVCSLRCNSSVLIGAGRIAKEQEHIEKIKKSGVFACN